MGLSSQAIADKAALLLQDISNIRWLIPDLAKWINEGCRELVRLKPSALTASVAMELAAGTKQSLEGAVFKQTTDGSTLDFSALQLFDVVRNLGATGMAPGRVVTAVERPTLDAVLPGWHAASSKGEVRHFLFDPKDPKTFYVYPQASSSPAMHLEVVVSRLPVNILDDSAVALGADDIDPGLDPIYESALVDYVLYRAHSQESESAGSAARAQGHLQAFGLALGVKIKNEYGLAPRRNGQQPNEAGG